MSTTTVPSLPAEQSAETKPRGMSAEGRAKISAAQKKRWSRLKAPKAVKTVRRMPVPANPSLAEHEIDSRLAQCIIERSTALQKVSALNYWQGRLKQLDEEIRTLLSYQQALHGQIVTTSNGPMPQFFPPGPPPMESSTPVVDPLKLAMEPYSHAAPIPAGVGSIPAKKVVASGSNAADMVATEGGFN